MSILKFNFLLWSLSPEHKQPPLLMFRQQSVSIYSGIVHNQLVRNQRHNCFYLFSRLDENSVVSSHCPQIYISFVAVLPLKSVTVQHVLSFVLILGSNHYVLWKNSPPVRNPLFWSYGPQLYHLGSLSLSCSLLFCSNQQTQLAYVTLAGDHKFSGAGSDQKSLTKRERILSLPLLGDNVAREPLTV